MLTSSDMNDVSKTQCISVDLAVFELPLAKIQLELH